MQRCVAFLVELMGIKVLTFRNVNPRSGAFLRCLDSG